MKINHEAVPALSRQTVRRDRAPKPEVTPMMTHRDGTAKLTVAEVCTELHVSRSTFYFWRQTGKGPLCIKLPNGELRVRRATLDAWLDKHEEAAA